VEDPISGELRDFSGFFPRWQWAVDLRRDIGDWSYGLNINDYRRFTFFRTDEFDSNFNGRPLGSVFVEHRPTARTSVTLNVEHVQGNRERLLFRPNRALTDQIIRETRERSRHLSVGLTLKQSFGGASSSGVAKAD
jgi:hypothetical protein